MYTNNFFDDIFQLKSIFDDFFNERDIPTSSSDFPFIRIQNDDEKVIIKLLVPGINTSDIDIQLSDNSLNITGEKKPDYEEQQYVRKERFFGKFKKSVKLPYRVNGDSIKADLTNGVLTVTLFKSEEAKPKRIQIN